MIVAALAIGLIGQTMPSAPATKPGQWAEGFIAAIDRLAGHGFAGSEIVIELDPSDVRRWKAAIWLHEGSDRLVPIAEQTVKSKELKFGLLPFGSFINKQIGPIGAKVDRDAWIHAKHGIRAATNLGDVTRVLFVIHRGGKSLSDAILENREFDVYDEMTISIVPNGRQDNLIPIDRAGTVKRIFHSCMGLRIPAFSTPGFPMSPYDSDEIPTLSAPQR